MHVCVDFACMHGCVHACRKYTWSVYRLYLLCFPSLSLLRGAGIGSVSRSASLRVGGASTAGFSRVEGFGVQGLGFEC